MTINLLTWTKKKMKRKSVQLSRLFATKIYFWKKEHLLEYFLALFEIKRNWLSQLCKYEPNNIFLLDIKKAKPKHMKSSKPLKVFCIIWMQNCKLSYAVKMQKKWINLYNEEMKNNLNPWRILKFVKTYCHL